MLRLMYASRLEDAKTDAEIKASIQYPGKKGKILEDMIRNLEELADEMMLREYEHQDLLDYVPQTPDEAAKWAHELQKQGLI